MRKVYLAGPINGCTDEEANGWRGQVRRALAGEFEFLDPMRRDYRGKEAEHAKDIVEFDLEDIQRADIILVNAERPSWGTAMETWFAGDLRKHVVIACPEPVSPWLRFVASRVVPTLADAIAHLREPRVRFGSGPPVKRGSAT